MSATLPVSQLPVPMPDRQAILQALDVLYDNDQIVEVRAFRKGRKQTDAGYYDSEHREQLADEVGKLNAAGAAVYLTLNRIDPQLIGRYHNRIQAYAEATATDANVIERRWLLLDFDPVRPKDTSATPDQLQAAHEKSRECYRFLKTAGWPDPVAAASGNGYHLLYPLALSADIESRDLVKGALEGLARRFDDDAVKVDQSVFNAARITKCYGTVANKGDHTEASPHRLSKLISTPTRGPCVTREQLKALHVDIERVVSRAPASFSTFDLAGFLSRLGIGYTLDMHEGSERFKLDHCPFNADHGKGEAAVFRAGAGQLGFKCQHNGCSDKTWQDVRALVDGPRETRQSAGTLRQVQAARSSDVEWPSPGPVRAELHAVDPLDLDIIPAPLRGWIADVADRMQCPPDFVATAAIVVAGTVIGAGCGVRPKREDDWLVIPNLWGGVIGKPSMLKSPAIGFQGFRPSASPLVSSIPGVKY